jgi:mobilizable transposon, int protein
LLSVTCSRSGNCPASGLVTEQPQYYVVICIFSIWQNTETMLISNGLRLIFFCLLFLAQPISFHVARHGFATLALSKGMPIESVSRVLGHTNIVTTQLYAKITTQKLDNDLTMFGDKLSKTFNGITMS